jgi:Sel1 repeat-containing protein
MNRRWAIVAVACLTLICGGAITWYFAHGVLTKRHLAKEAAAARVRAEQGDAEGQFRLGAMYSSGKGVPQDYGEAVGWLRKSAEQGNAKAQYDLGYMYREGKGVPQDYGEGARWCHKAAEQGFAPAEEALGYMYYRGEGVPQDYGDALRWYRKSADQGYARAEAVLGSMYFYGEGVSQDYAAAERWYRKSAEHGNADAQYALGYMYYYGNGVRQDRVEANRLFQQAASQGQEDARQTVGMKKVHVSAPAKIKIAVTFVGALIFAIGLLKSGHKDSNRARVTTGLTVLLLLISVVLDLFWYSYIGHLQSKAILTAVYLSRHLVAGVLIALLVSMVRQKSARGILIAAAAMFSAFVVVAVIRAELRHASPEIRFLCFIGLPIGMAIPSSILLWLDRKRSDQGLASEGDATQTAPAK